MSDERPQHFLREWREFRELTQEQLAEKVGTTKAVISHLEVGRSGLSGKWLYRLAPALGTRAGAILDYDPNDIPNDLLETWSSISDEQKPQAMAVLQTFRKRA